MRLLVNARIHTLDTRQPFATALALQHGRIVALGESEAMRQAAPLGAEVIDLGGRTVLPGLTDAHIHLQHYGLALQKVNCETTSKEECLRRVAARVQESAPGAWVLGHGWNQNEWDEAVFPTAADLDQIAPHNPVYLTAKSLHAGWANQAALQRAGLSAASADPQGGKLGRTSDGDLSGIVFESAMNLVFKAIPAAGAAQIEAALELAQQSLWRMGVTGVHDFDRQECFAALQSLHQAGKLRLRVLKSLPLESLAAVLEVGLRSGFGDDWLKIGSIKAFADGALGPRTAAMLADYEGEPGNRGMLLLDGETLFEHARQAAAGGLSMAVHAIGDLANHEVLNAYAQLREYERAQGLTPLRHRLEHVQVIHPQDAPRLAQLGIVASMQPIHAISDMRMADRYWGERARYAYAWRTQQNYGAWLAFGSDAPVDAPNPFWGLHATLTRRRLDGTPGPDGWYPEEALDLTSALAAYTQGPAYTAGWEDRQGKLAAGYFADLIVLDDDPFALPADQLAQVLPRATLAGGEFVFNALD